MNVELEYTISDHAQQRYAERIMGKDDNCDAKQFIINNKDKIQRDINKMIHHGQKIYSGKPPQKGNQSNLVDVYLKDTWIVLANNNSKIVVTLYKIDLGLDDEFNRGYVSKMIDKLNERKRTLKDVQQRVQEESDMYQGMIDDFESQIKEYKTMIKNLEELCSGYKTVIHNNCVKVSQAEREVADVINTLVNRKEFQALED